MSVIDFNRKRRTFLRILLAFALLTVMRPSHAIAQPARCGGQEEELDPDPTFFNAIIANEVAMKPHGVRVNAEAFANIMGRARAANGITARWQPRLGKCDPTTDNSIYRTEQLFAGTPPNVSGAAAAGGSNVGSSLLGPVAKLGSRANIDDVLTGYLDAGDFAPYHAFRWTEATRFVDLGTLDPANNAVRFSAGTGISADGSVIVGFSQVAASTFYHAFRWTSTGMVDLGVPAGAQYGSRALGVSDNGAVIVGDASFQDNNAFTGVRSGAFRWTASGGMVSLGALVPGFPSVATDVSADGATIVGQGGVPVGNSTGSRAFRWTSATGLQAIGPPPGYTDAVATGVSDNGKVVVGVAANGPIAFNKMLDIPQGVAWRWTEAGGIQDLKALLISKGFKLTGWTLVSAIAISGDGQYIVGEAITPTTPPQETRAYLLKLCDAAANVTCTPFKSPPVTPPPVTPPPVTPPTTPPTNPTPSFDFLTSSATSATALAGSSVTAVLSVSPVGGFNQSVTFSCAGLPSRSACAFSPATLTPGAAAVTTTLTISTTAPSVGGAASIVTWSDDTPASVVIVTMCFAIALLQRRRRTAVGLRPIAAGVAVLALFSSCGGGGGDDKTVTPPTQQPPLTGGTPAGTFPVVVTATSGTGTTAISKTLTFTLTVTR